MIDKLESTCPECSHSLRREYWVDDSDRGRVTGFCDQCLKNFEICTATNCMAPCIKMKNHSDQHLDYNGREFK